MSRIIEFRKSAQKAEKQSVQGKTCAFTGHRPQSLPFGFDESDKRCTSLKSVMRDQIVALIENEGVTHFITGMALGVDMYAAEIVLDLKSKYPHITLESAIPCETQAIKWSVASPGVHVGLHGQEKSVHGRSRRLYSRSMEWMPQRYREHREICPQKGQIYHRYQSGFP